MLAAMVEMIGEAGALMGACLGFGLALGFMARCPRFCLRSAVIGFGRAQPGGRLTVWLFAFAVGVGATRLLALAGLFGSADARQIKCRYITGAIRKAHSWLALCAMWAAAAITDRLVDRCAGAAPDPSIDRAALAAATAATAFR